MLQNISIRKLVFAAAAFHLGVTTVVFLAGKAALFPQFINTRGVIAADSQVYQSQALLLADVLSGSGVAAWFCALLPLHVKLYSLCFALFGGPFGSTILSLEPLNVALFLSVLCLVFKLSREVFEGGAGLLAAAIVGLWPSFLLSTTQLLRDPLFVASFLLFLLLTLRWLTEIYSVRGALGVAALGAFIECVLWLSRSDMWELMIGIALMNVAVLAVRVLGERKVLWGNITGAALMLLMSLIIPRAAVQLYKPAYDWAKSYGVAFTDYSEEALRGGGQPNARPVPGGPRRIGTHLPARISALRERFTTQYPDAGSNIDTGVRFDSTADILAHLPRATAVGLFAPFPQMWFATGGQTGRAGRLVAAGETIALYAIQLLALVGLWHKRRELSAWFLLTVSISGATALGLVVTNVGALYRMRYAFVMPLVILGSEGIRLSLNHLHSRKRRGGGVV